MILYFKTKKKFSSSSNYCLIIINYYFNSYRIEYTVDMIQDISLKNGHLIYKGIVCAVNIHRQAIKFVYSLEHFKSLCIILKYYYNFIQSIKLYTIK